MRNPIHKRIERFESWQNLTFMLCLCERMYPNFKLFCEVTEQPDGAKIYQNILNLIWEYLTIKGVKINFEIQLEKLEAVIPNVNQYDFYGVFPAEEACEGLSELLHAIIAGETLETAVKLSKLSLSTVATFLETTLNKTLNEQELKNSEAIQTELDIQWQLYRTLAEYEERDVDLILSHKNEIRENGTSNIGININQ